MGMLEKAQALVNIALPAINFVEESRDADGKVKKEKGRPATKDEFQAFKNFARNEPEFMQASILGELFVNDGPKDPEYLKLCDRREELKAELQEINDQIKEDYPEIEKERIVMEAVTVTVDGIIMAFKSKKKMPQGLPVSTVLTGEPPSRGRKKSEDSGLDDGDDNGDDEGDDEGEE